MLVEHQMDVKTLADGLYTAMTTTVGGLIVGIVAYIAYNHLVVKTRQSGVSNGSEFGRVFRSFKRTDLSMNLRGRNKVTPEFNMSSMTDIVFLLLIFFMIASTLVSAEAIDIIITKSK